MSLKQIRRLFWHDKYTNKSIEKTSWRQPCTLTYTIYVVIRLGQKGLIRGPRVLHTIHVCRYAIWSHLQRISLHFSLKESWLSYKFCLEVMMNVLKVFITFHIFDGWDERDITVIYRLWCNYIELSLGWGSS